jgi:hypothetical protein
VKEYLSTNTFYIVQTDDENKLNDSTSIQFCNFNDFYGITINSIQKQNDTVYLYDKASNLVLSDFVFNKESSDTVADVMFGDNYLRITKSGMVYLITQDGNMFPLEKTE